MNKRGCIITYATDGYMENTLKSVIRLGINKVILVDENDSCIDLFKKFGLATDVAPIISSDVGAVVKSFADIISKAKDEHEEVSVLLPHEDPVIITGMYIAACTKNVKVLTPLSESEIQCLNLPLFPFLNLNENERFILEKLAENKGINTRNLIKIIKKDKEHKPLFKEKSESRQVQRILNKLEKTGLANKRKSGRYFVWSSTQFGKLMVI